MQPTDCRILIEQLDLRCDAGPSAAALEQLGAAVGRELAEQLRRWQAARAAAIARGTRAPGRITVSRLDVELGDLARTPIDPAVIATRVVAALEARLAW